MTGSRHRCYGDLAPWWPLVSAPEEYAEEAAFAATLLRSGAATTPGRRPTVLELGSGGGNNAFHLKGEFDLTLVDLSPEMVAVSERLNPECAHQVGDMRTVRLDEQFDAVFVHDAIEYMTTEDDLRQAAATVYAHCRPGGVAVLVPDDIADTFAPSTDCGGHDGSDGRGIRYLSWTTDPDPSDTTSTTEYAFLVRQADGTVSVAQDTHVLGIFARRTWLTVLAETGFAARSVVEMTTEECRPREFFVGLRPA